MPTAEILARTPLFGTLPEDVVLRLAPWFTPRRVAIGDVILTEGEPAAKLVIVVHGSLVVCKRVQGVTEALVARVGPGAHLGEIDLVDGEMATATVLAESDGEVLELDADRFRRMLVTDRPLFAHVARVLFVDLAEKVRVTNAQVRETIAWGLDACGELAG